MLGSTLASCLGGRQVKARARHVGVRPGGQMEVTASLGSKEATRLGGGLIHSDPGCVIRSHLRRNVYQANYKGQGVLGHLSHLLAALPQPPTGPLGHLPGRHSGPSVGWDSNAVRRRLPPGVTPGTLSSSGFLGPLPDSPAAGGCKTGSLAVGLSAHRHGWAAHALPCLLVFRPPSALIGRSCAQNMFPKDL